MEMTAWKAEGRGAKMTKKSREVDGDDGVESGRKRKNANGITIYWTWLGYRSLEEWTESKDQSLQDFDVQG